MTASVDQVSGLMTATQKVRLLYKVKFENRRNQKSFLKDCRGTGSAEGLNSVVGIDGPVVKMKQAGLAEACGISRLFRNS